MHPVNNRQQGATLITALIMLIVLTLLVVSGIRSSSTNLRIAGNMQMQEEASAAAQQAIERVISSATFDTTPQTIGNYTVTIAPPSCQSAKVAVSTDVGISWECGGSAGSTSCYWTTWEIVATALDNNSGATTEIHQGISMLRGSTVAFASCNIS